MPVKTICHKISALKGELKLIPKSCIYSVHISLSVFKIASLISAQVFLYLFFCPQSVSYPSIFMFVHLSNLFWNFSNIQSREFFSLFLFSFLDQGLDSLKPELLTTHLTWDHSKQTQETQPIPNTRCRSHCTFCFSYGNPLTFICDGTSRQKCYQIKQRNI